MAVPQVEVLQLMVLIPQIRLQQNYVKNSIYALVDFGKPVVVIRSDDEERDWMRPTG